MDKMIKVTKKDIKLGTPNHRCKCPVALALSRQIPGIKWEVAYDFISAYPSGLKEHKFLFGCPASTLTPTKVSRWIGNFDSHKPVKPFSFRLRYKKGT